MDSYQNRLETFKNWNRWSGQHKLDLFAITGFFCTSNSEEDNTTCIFCLKSLQEWADTDIPVEEHYVHSTKCPLFNLNNYISRKRTFEVSKIDKKYDTAFLSKCGFFSFRLKSAGPGNIFCFKCGFSLEVGACKSLRHEAQKHVIVCPRRGVRNFSFNLGNLNKIFYIDLLSGKYNESIRRYLEKDVLRYVPSIEVAGVLEKAKNGNQLMNIEDALLESLERATSSLERILDRDTKRILKAFDISAKAMILSNSRMR